MLQPGSLIRSDGFRPIDDEGKEWEAVATVGSSASNVSFSIQVRTMPVTRRFRHQTTDQSLVELDTEKPSLENITLVSSNLHDSSFAKDGDNLTLRFNVYDQRSFKPRRF